MLAPRQSNLRVRGQNAVPLMAAAGEQGSQLRVLVVEDNPGDVDLVREALAGIALVEHVDRIGTVRARLAQGEPDLILLDLSLPDASGLEGLEQMRALAPGVPVIVLTGSAASTLGTRAVHAGAEDFLSKQDVSSPWLARAVKYAVERHRSRQREKLLAVEHAARIEAERASRSKDEFLAVLSHELRNPLAPIRFALGLMKQPGVKESSVRQACDVIQRQMHQFVRLVDDLLDIAYITQNKLQLNKEPVSLAAVMETAVEAVADSVRAARQTIRVNGPAPDVVLNADGARFAQVLTNLLSNAVKFTPEGGEISLAAERAGEDMIVSVRDTGVGFPADAAGRIFQMFHREKDMAQKPGLGIGLALAKRLVDLHGWSLEARSDGKDCGAEFSIRLPSGAAQGLANAQAREAAAANDPLRVLVVDDNTDAARMLAIFLEEQGHRSLAAYDGESALAQASEFRPEVAVLDIGLPDIDGYMLGARLRRLLPEIQLIAMTGFGSDDAARRVREAGFCHHLVKPTDPAVLKAILGDIARAPRPLASLAEPPRHAESQPSASQAGRA